MSAALTLVAPAAYAGEPASRPAAGPPAASAAVLGFTAPFRKATLASLQQGRVSRIDVEEGHHVDQGDLLILLDASVQKPRTEIARLEAESSLKVDLARVQMEYARDELGRITRLNRAVAASERETRDAKLKFDAATLNHGIAAQDHAISIETYRLQEELLKQHELRAPFAGVVTARLKEVGETVEQLEGVLELSQLDTLLVVADCPLVCRDLLKVGDTFAVTPSDVRWNARAGKVAYIIPVADAGSQTFKIKLAVPNNDGAWISGLLVSVDLNRKMQSPGSQPASAPAN